MLAPAGTPKPIIDKLNAVIAQIVATPEAREFITARGNDVRRKTSPGYYVANIKRETERSAGSSRRSATRRNSRLARMASSRRSLERLGSSVARVVKEAEVPAMAATSTFPVATGEQRTLRMLQAGSYAP